MTSIIFFQDTFVAEEETQPVDTYWNQYKMLPKCSLAIDSAMPSLRRQFSWVIFFPGKRSKDTGIQP